jgi:hypothetical protein
MRKSGRSLMSFLWGVVGWTFLVAAAHAQPANDNFADAVTLSGDVVSTTGSNVGATREAGEPQHAGNATSASVWWRWTANRSGTVNVDTVGSSFDTVLAIYTGATVNGLTEIGSNDDSGGGLQSRVIFQAVQGTTYQIAVAGFDAAVGSIRLQLLAGEPPPRIASNPAPGSALMLPAGLLGSVTQLRLDLITTGGSTGSSLQVTCNGGSGVLVGPAGSAPNSASFSQTVNAGSQPADLQIAATVAATEQRISNGLICQVQPSLGDSYTLEYSVVVPAAQAADSAPLISALPAGGSRLLLRPALAGGSARGGVDLQSQAGSGGGSAAVNCSATGNLLIGAAGSTPSSSNFAFSLAASQAPPDLELAAAVGTTATTAELNCLVTPSRGAAYTLSFSVVIPAAIAAEGGAWEAQGPIEVTGGQVEGVSVPRANPVAGAIHVVVPHPSNADVLYVGAVNGGVWKTRNATAPDPRWVRLTDSQSSLSIGALDLDRSVADGETLVAGIGRFSSYARLGGARSGLLRTTNGGDSWTVLDGNMRGKNISGVVARGNVIVAAVDTADSFTCSNVGLFRSIDSGASFTRLLAAQGFPGGGVDALAGHPTNPNVMYASLEAAGSCASNAALNGIYRTADGGSSWAKVSDAVMDALIDQGSSSNYLFRIQVAPDGAVVVAIARGTLLGVFHSANDGTSWTSLGVPQTIEGDEAVGIHPGRQGSLHLSVAISPTDSNLVFVGGDRQPRGGTGAFPNSIGAANFSGRLFRADARGAGVWTSITHNGTASFGSSQSPAGSAPHADSRSMAFDAAGRLIEGDDGGVYARLSPANSTGDWVSLNGDLQVTEQHSLAYDPLARVTQSGNQDNANMRQLLSGQPQWGVVLSGDGGAVAVDRFQFAAEGRSMTFSSAQNLGSFSRRTYDADNNLLRTEFPSLRVTGNGATPQGQFLTPVIAHQLQPRRLAIGAANGIYESFDSGTTAMLVDPNLRAFSIPTAGSLAYGAIDNPDVLYAAACAGDCDAGGDGLFVRRALGDPMTLLRPDTPGFRTVSVTLDRRNSNRVFLLEQSSTESRIHRSIDGGLNWTDVTGDLPVGSGAVRIIRFLPGPNGSMLAAGTDRSVYLASETEGFAVWRSAGSGLPGAPVYALDYDESQDLLVAGTLGRGSYKLSGPVVRTFPAAPVGNVNPPPGTDYSGAWSNPNESGWGLIIVRGGSGAYGVYIFHYGDDSKPDWYLAPGVLTGNRFQANVNAFTGPWFGTVPYNPANLSARVAGTITVDFSSDSNASVSFTIDGRTVNSTLRKLSF